MNYMKEMNSMRAIRIWVGVYPFCLIAAMYATAVAAWMILGHWPRASVDDPKAIGGAWMSVWYQTTVLLTALGLPAFGLGAVALIVRAARSADERRGLLMRVGGAILSLTVVVAILWWDPHSVAAWIAD